MAASSGRAPARGHAVRRGPAARTLSADVADVADERAVAALFDTAESTFGGIDVVVHAAGRMHLAPIAELDLTALDVLREETVARLAAQPPLERLGTPADIAEVVAFLVGPRGHWINGLVIRANGGIV